MKKARLMLAVAALVAAAVVPSEVEAQVACVDSYLLCLNDASQQEGRIYRTLREAECGLDYWGCLKRKAEGA